MHLRMGSTPASSPSSGGAAILSFFERRLPWNRKTSGIAGGDAKHVVDYFGGGLLGNRCVLEQGTVVERCGQHVENQLDIQVVADFASLEGPRERCTDGLAA